MLQLDGKTPPEDDGKEKSGEGAPKFESEAQNNTTLEGKVRCPLEENTCANDYEFDGESYFYKDLKTGKNKLILVEGKFGLLKHFLGERNFKASFNKTFLLQEHLKELGISSRLSFYISIIPTYDYKSFFFTISVL